MPNEPRLQSRDIVFSSQETTQRTPQEASPRAITISAMTGNTLSSAQLVSPTHVGCIVVPEDGVLRQNPSRILSIAAGVATLDRTYHSTNPAGSVFSLWIPAAAPVVADSGSTTTLVDATHAGVTNEPDDYCKGDFLLVRSGANAGGAYKIAAFTSSTGTYSIAGDPAGTAIAAGVLADVVTLARPEGPVNVSVDLNVIDRRIQGYADADQAVATISPGTIDMEFALKPVITSAADTVVAVPPYEMGRYLRDVMTETKDTGTTYVSQTGSAPAINVTVASGAGLTVGGFALFSNGEVSQIIDKPSANVLVCPQLTAATLVASSNVYASCHYKRKEADFRTRTWFDYIGGLDLSWLQGCAPTIEINLLRDAVIKFAMKYTAGDAMEYTPAVGPNTLANHRFSLAVDTTVPVDGKGARVMIDAVPFLQAAVKITFGFKTLLRMAMGGMNQADGYAFDDEPVMWNVQGVLADNNAIAANQKFTDRIRRADPFSLFYQKGRNSMEWFAAAAPTAQITKLSKKATGGMWEYDFDAKCVLPQLARGSTANAALPAFSIGYGG